MSLADYESKYLEPGEHSVRVAEVRCFRYKTGSPGLEVRCADYRGRTSKASFVLMEKCFWVLAGFAKACGLTPDELKAYEPSDPTAHMALIGREFIASVAQDDGGYSEIVGWKRIGSTSNVLAIGRDIVVPVPTLPAPTTSGPDVTRIPF